MGNLFISIVISIIGAGYFYYGKKENMLSFLICGLILMIYPYFISSLVLSIIIGVVLVAVPFFLV